MSAGATHGAETDVAPANLDSAHPLPDGSLEDVKNRFRQLALAANRYDAAAIEKMFWDSPSALLVAKSVDPAEGKLGGFLGDLNQWRASFGISTRPAHSHCFPTGQN